MFNELLLLLSLLMAALVIVMVMVVVMVDGGCNSVISGVAFYNIRLQFLTSNRSKQNDKKKKPREQSWQIMQITFQLGYFFLQYPNCRC